MLDHLHGILEIPSRIFQGYWRLPLIANLQSKKRYIIGQTLTKPYCMTALFPLGSSDWLEGTFLNLVFLGLGFVLQ